MGGNRILVMLATLATVLGACQRPPEETSFGVGGSYFDCIDEKCTLVFSVDNGMPQPVKARYRAVLSDERGGTVVELSDDIEIPGNETLEVTRTVSVSGHPDRLKVTVTTLNGV